MNELLIPLIVAVALGFVAGVIACVVYLALQAEGEPQTKPTTLPPVYTEEEIALAQFLEQKQTRSRKLVCRLALLRKRA
ncbi:hypothetical protein [Streptococcus intermedius]|uniref:hypothetical protein n=1 Tax=Streptococcus intermedius TaxID=1338 RepID=UPI000F66A2A9|nr:hypothetical protein [Streptococcus intermedius]RSJ26400.1 hypothetical protein D8826_03780 [Streptococcus intermedius]